MFVDPAPNHVPRPLAHESVVVDPDTHAIYQTEDAGNPNGLLYRWTPPPSALPLGTCALKTLSAAGTRPAG